MCCCCVSHIGLHNTRDDTVCAFLGAEPQIGPQIDPPVLLPAYCCCCCCCYTHSRCQSIQQRLISGFLVPVLSDTFTYYKRNIE